MSNKINIDLNEAGEQKLFHRDAILLFYYKYNFGYQINGVHNRLKDLGLINEISPGYFVISEEGEQMINKINGKVKKKELDDKELDELTTKLRDIYPKGKKSGSPYYWRGTQRNIKKKIKSYKLRTGHTDDQILNATKRYIDSFEGDMKYMKLLEYFIEKNGESQLEIVIENDGQENEDKGELWVMEIV